MNSNYLSRNRPLANSQEMHGNHYLSDEYKISATRLKPDEKSNENLSFRRSKSKSASSPAYENIRHTRFMKIFFTAILAIILFIVGAIKSLGLSNIKKFHTVPQLMIAYMNPKLLMFKRSIVPGTDDLKMSSFAEKSSKETKTFPAPLHLVIALNNLNEAKRILNMDKYAHLIIPKVNWNSTYYKKEFNSTMNARIQIQHNATSLFEIISFSWCQMYRRNQKYPTKLIVIGPSKVTGCVLDRYRWALKIPKSIISFRVTNISNDNSTSSIVNKCNQIRNDPFDCAAKDREEIRFKFSQMCPELSPFLLACNNRLSLKRALTYIPLWALKNKS